MRLKSLEINGFKSFANRTLLFFPSRVTAVVGPNGSGKSNVADAIRWVLGERDFRGLRVAKSEEIIFGGTPKKARLSLASVILTLDNSQKELPIDFDEVAVARKINRAGESEYLINGAAVRLKDIIEILAKAKIGAGGITIVNQGSADAILKASPKERRQMIEENLGLKEFQLKREEAKRKLMATGTNLEQTQSLVDELLPHLKSLRRQLSRWEKREGMMVILSHLEKIFFARQFKQILEIKNQTNEQKNILEGKKQEEEKDLSRLEEQFKKIENERPDFSGDLAKVRSEMEKLEKEKGEILRSVGQAEGQLEGLRKIIQHKPKNIENKSVLSSLDLEQALKKIKIIVEQILTSDNLSTIRIELQKIADEIERVFHLEKKKEVAPAVKENPILDEATLTEIKKIEEQKKELLEKIEQITISLGKFNQQWEELRQKDNQAGLDSRALFLAIQKKRGEISQLQARVNEILLNKERAKIKEEDLIEKLKESGLSSQNFSEERLREIDIASEMKEAGLEDRDLFDLEEKIIRLRRELASIGEVDELMAQEAKETEERYQFLTRELNDLNQAKLDLEKLSNELAEKVHNIFSQALKEINEEFNKYFRIMFGGGHGRLNLVFPIKKKIEINSDEEIKNGSNNNDSQSINKKDEVSENNLQEERELEAGIEFQLELPKKKINSLEVLSGGERTLVSVSALFAIVAAMRPPFVVLDEVDAALDEANARRFSKILDDLDERTQFVLITHNRSTMEAAQSLYGVTMSDEGISKAVSLKFEEAE